MDILRIIDSIANKLIQEKLNDNGLLQGNAGLSIFFAYLFLFTEEEKYLVNSEKLINLSIDSIETGNISSCTFCNGVSGVMWQLNHLIKIGILETEISNNIISDDIIGLMTQVSIRYLQMGDYDFLHGGLGPAMCFLNHTNSFKEREGFKNILHLLVETLEIKQDTFLFKNEFKSRDNLGLSHGIPSVVSILAKAIKYNMSTEKSEKLLHDSLNLIKSKKNEDGLSLYPNLITDEKPYNSRLAWCYGDLGVASAFWKAGKAMNNQEWKNEAIAIMLHSSKRRDLKENNVLDACFCHGTSGIAHIFNRFYKETGIKEFNEARWYWLQKTLGMATWNGDLADYKTWLGQKGWKNESGLLEGIAGIGLVLLGFLTNDIINLSWDECLLLS